MSAVAERAAWVKAERSALGWSAQQLADRARLFAQAAGYEAALKQQSISAFENGTAKRTPQWLRFVEAAIAEAKGGPAASSDPGPDSVDFVSIASIDQDYGLGGTYVDGPVEQEVMLFPRQWVESITDAPPELLTWTRGKGDSMVPTIHHGDLVLFNRAERTIRETDALWVYTIGDVGSIKRLRLRGRKVTILSDNKDVPPDEADVDEMNMIGRVVFIGKRY
jgi:phage repressor protein C with HTH and peptisase S24 domain